MTADANVTSPEPAVEAPIEQPAEPAAESVTVDPPAEPVPSPRQRTWSMPKSPISRKQADDLGRLAVKSGTGIARFIATIARSGARAVRHLWRIIEAVPAAVQLFGVAAIGMLLGIVGAITVSTTLGVICTVVVIPVCAGILGALGHRWYSGLGVDSTPQSEPAEPTQSDLQRSVQYVDKKLAAALTSFGTEHHQQAVIAVPGQNGRRAHTRNRAGPRRPCRPVVARGRLRTTAADPPRVDIGTAGKHVIGGIVTGPTIAGQVALIEDDYTLVINRGREAGVRPGMIFAVQSTAGPVITDPESGRELGRLSREKVRVRVFDVQQLFARAHTFVETDNVYGLLQIHFDTPVEEVVTVDVGDSVTLIDQHTATGIDRGAAPGLSG